VTEYVEYLDEEDCTIYDSDGVQLMVVPGEYGTTVYRAVVGKMACSVAVSNVVEERRLWLSFEHAHAIFEAFTRYPEEQMRLAKAMEAVGWLE